MFLFTDGSINVIGQAQCIDHWCFQIFAHLDSPPAARGKSWRGLFSLVCVICIDVGKINTNKK